MITFAHPNFLWAFAGLLIPLALHLLNRRQDRRILFPTIRFLQKTALPREGRHRIQDILMLLLRMLIFSSLILLLARPVWKSAPAAETANHSLSLRLLLLDQSASMQAPRIRKALEDILQQLSRDSSGLWGLICFDSKARLVFPPRANQLPAILRYLKSEDAAPGYLNGAPDSALRLAAGLLEKHAGEREMLILSDCQSSNWEKITTLLPRNIKLRFFPGLRITGLNAGIQRVISAPLKDGKVRLSVLVRNYSDSPGRSMLTVRLGEETQQQELSLPAGGQIPAAFVFRQKNLQMQGTASLEDDALPFDNIYEFWSGFPPPEKVLLVQENPAGGDRNAALENYFLQQALTTETEERPPRYLPAVIPASTLFAVNYSGYSRIFLLGTAELLTQGDWDRLAAFVQKGGTLFITPGKSPQTALHLLRQAGLTRARYLGQIGADSRQAGLGIGWVRPDSILGGLFSEKTGNDLYLFPIRRYLHLDSPEDSRQHILLKTLDGRPALLEWLRGSGRIYFFTFGFTPEWSDLVLSQSFLPLVRELCSGGAPRPEVSASLICGQQPPRFYQLNGEEILPAKDFSILRPGSHAIGSHLIEYHPDPEESRTSCSSSDALSRFLLRQQSQRIKTSADASPDAIELWKYLSLLLAILLLLEGFFMIRTDSCHP